MNRPVQYFVYIMCIQSYADGFEVGYHVNDLESNEFQLLDIARNFLLSPEFGKTYGVNQSDEDYVKTYMKMF